MVEKSGGSAADITLSCNVNKSAFEWHEIKNDNGSSYFWNTKTNGKLKLKKLLGLILHRFLYFFLKNNINQEWFTL